MILWAIFLIEQKLCIALSQFWFAEENHAWFPWQFFSKFIKSLKWCKTQCNLVIHPVLIYVEWLGEDYTCRAWNFLYFCKWYRDWEMIPSLKPTLVVDFWPGCIYRYSLYDCFKVIQIKWLRPVSGACSCCFNWKRCYIEDTNRE